MQFRNRANQNINYNSPLTLQTAPAGVPLQVTAIQAGHTAAARLASMGIFPGETLRIVQRENSGPILVEIKGTRIALGQGISEKVLVSANGFAG